MTGSLTGSEPCSEAAEGEGSPVRAEGALQHFDWGMAASGQRIIPARARGKYSRAERPHTRHQGFSQDSASGFGLERIWGNETGFGDCW